MKSIALFLLLLLPGCGAEPHLHTEQRIYFAGGVKHTTVTLCGDSARVTPAGEHRALPEVIIAIQKREDR